MNSVRHVIPASAVLLAIGLAASSPGPVHAGGLVRPNVTGARATGLSGAYAAVAEDSTAVFHNPAGLLTLRNADALVSLEFVFAYQRFTPVGWPTEKTSLAPLPSPTITVGGRIKVGTNSYMAFGFGLYNSMGGGVEFKQRPISEGVVKTRMGLFEFVPALAYEIDRRVLLGLSLRVGLGYFETTQLCGEPFTCLSRKEPRYTVKIDPMYGVGFGYALGILVEPFDNFKLGVVYRSNINVRTKVQKGLHAINQDITAELKLPFPQSVSVGAAYRFNPRWLVSAQFDWVDHSSFHKAMVELSGYDPATTPVELVTLQLYWRDTYAVHVGVEYRPVKRFALRGGMTFDSQAVPERYMAREIQDSNKLAFDVGASVYLGRWRVEAAFEAIAGPVDNGFKPRTNPDSYLNAGKFYPHAAFSFHVGGGVTF